MADTPSAIVLATASTLDGTEHVVVSQSGTQRSVALSSVKTLVTGSLILPAADPHIVGAWWDNAGTLTKSSG